MTNGRPRSVVLASRSERRRALLCAAGLEVTVAPADIDEAVVEAAHRDGGPAAVAEAVAVAKARALGPLRGDPVVAADTVVWTPAGPVGAPADRRAAVEILVALSGATLTVATGVVVDSRGTQRCLVRTSQVALSAITRRDALDYVATGAADDTAGGLELQGRGARFLGSVTGCWTNVIGLPMCAVATLLGMPSEPVLCRTRDGARCPAWDGDGVDAAG